MKIQVDAMVWYLVEEVAMGQGISEGGYGNHCFLELGDLAGGYLSHEDHGGPAAF